MKTLQVTARNLTVISFLALLAVASVHGQTGAALRASVPFDFEVGGKSVPAGTYQLRLRLGEGAVVMSGAKAGDMRLPIISRLGTGTLFTDATLIFDTFEGHHALSEVWVPGEEGVLVKVTPKGHAHEKVIAVVSGPAPKLSGKQVFERTCARCHGPKGQGNPAADKFFQTPVPKLDSAYVQGKSDEELKEIISHGRRMMDPVRVGQAQVQHLLDSGSVDAVISYVRTLKRP
jgi:cytochrome c553